MKMWMVLGGAVLSFVSMLSCEECGPSETRCAGQEAQVCSSSGRWEPLADCDRIEGGGEWVCCFGGSGDYNCRQASECTDGGGD